jgi:dihydroorotate dehydrogenase electron transfer subunit
VGDPIHITDEYHAVAEMHVTTEDGSRGVKGRVTDHPLLRDEFNFGRIYTCGPDPMMKALAAIAREKGVVCEASLENTMACGFGACLCCVVKTTEGHKCVCTEGPVFPTTHLENW